MPNPTNSSEDPYNDEITSEETAEALRRFNLKRKPNPVDPNWTPPELAE